MPGAKRRGLSRRSLGFLIAGVACLAGLLVYWRNSAFVTQAAWQQYVPSSPGSAEAIAFDPRLVPQIEAFCGDCHAVPLAENYPRDAWHRKVRRGYEFYSRSGRNDLDPPPIRETVAYYRSLAPEKIVLPQPPDAPTRPGVAFLPQHLSFADTTDVPPGIGHLQWIDLEQNGKPVLVVCDMRRGYVSALDLRDSPPAFQHLAALDNPCHVEPCDLDGDGLLDLVVADLGSFHARDHDQGRVVWLRRRPPVGDYEPIVVASGLGRVANNQAVAIDGDGDLDLLVAEFGYNMTGKIALLTNTAEPGERPEFETQVLDPRPGTSHILVHDLNDDGRPDFLALTSQEHEWIAALLNRPDGPFERQTLWAAPDLTFGLTGMWLVDLDQDRDVDVLFTNGDTFDDQYVRPSHGVQWLENRGSLEFTYRRLTDLPGAHAAQAGDFDRDGDLDVVAVSWLHDQLYPVGAASGPMDSIVYLEQSSPGKFERHRVEVGFPYHATLEAADFDADGDLDFAVGWQPHQGWREHSITVWWNQAVRKND